MVEIFGKSMTVTVLLGQLMSAVAMVITVLSFQFKKRSRILTFQIIGNIFFLTSYILLGLWSATAMNIIYIIRNTVYMFKDRSKLLGSAVVPGFFCALCIAAGVFSYASPRDLLTTIGALFGCVALYMNDEKRLLLIKSGDSVCWLIYNLISFVSGGIICEVSNLVSIAVGIARINRNRTKA